MNTEWLTFGVFEGSLFLLQIRYTASDKEECQTCFFSDTECVLVVIRNNVLHLLCT